MLRHEFSIQNLEFFENTNFKKNPDHTTIEISEISAAIAKLNKIDTYFNPTFQNDLTICHRQLKFNWFDEIWQMCPFPPTHIFFSKLEKV